MTDILKHQLNKFEKSYNQLQVVLKRDLKEDNIILDATIKRFEFVFENCWKTLKVFLKFKGDDCLSPRDCIKKAYRYGWIKHEDIYLEFLEYRNLSSHTYEYDIAFDIYRNVKKKYTVFFDLIQKLKGNNE